jgi:hypothetical protein
VNFSVKLNLSKLINSSFVDERLVLAALYLAPRSVFYCWFSSALLGAKTSHVCASKRKYNCDLEDSRFLFGDFFTFTVYSGP